MRFLPLIAILAASLAGPTRVYAQDDGGETTRLAGERTQLRQKLDRANAEVDALKREPRGVRSDYRLRDRMAEAEALARKLTEVETKLRALGAPVDARPLPGLVTEPEAAPHDGPAELDAKADILDDEARRLGREADELFRRVGHIRGRQELRRRAGQMERDPFAGLEGSKRRTVSATSSGNRAAAPQDKTSTDQSPSSPPSGGGGSGGSGGSGGEGGGESGGFGSPDRQGTPPTGDPGVSFKLRDVLDPAMLAEIRRVDPGRPGVDLQTLERVAAVLREKSLRLGKQAQNLRDRAHPRARAP